MRQVSIAVIAATMFLCMPAVAQETPPGMVSTYDALADAILAVKRAEAGFVRALLEHHFDAARAAYEQRDYRQAAANIALFANEGDNAIAGIRKRLVEGGHHHHASDEDNDAFDQGFVIVDKKSKETLLEAAALMRQARRKSAAEAWQSFETAAGALLATE